MPIFSISSNEHQISARVFSISLRGAMYGFSRSSRFGAGSALRSIFPLGVNGRASKVTKVLGTMYSGIWVLR